MKTTTQYTVIGAATGSLLGFWLSSRKHLSRAKKVLATVGGGVVGGGAGYGVGHVVQKKKADLGWMDLYRVNADSDDDGKSWITKYPYKVPTKPVKDKPPNYGAPRTDLPSSKEQPWGGSDGSKLLTSTTKLRAPSWSTRAALTCPAVGYPIRLKLEELGKSKKDLTDDQVMDELMTVVPAKCLNCYAMGGNYIYPDVKQAQLRRSRWFTEGKDGDVVNDLVDAISHAGREYCDKEIPGECTFIPNVPAKYFRLFDSGDFNSVRDVEIWTEVARRLPDVKFWAPTTAHETCKGYEPPHHGDMIKKLKLMNKLPNVVVRPSGKKVGDRAGRYPGFGAGSTVLSTDRFDKEHDKIIGDKVRPTSESNNPNLLIGRDHSDIPHKWQNRWVNVDGEKTWVCPGDCTFCRACWNKNTKVAYLLHTLTAGEKGKDEKKQQAAKRKQMMKLIKAATGTEDVANKSKKTQPEWEEINRNMAHYLISNEKVGPDRPSIRWAKERQRS